MKSDRLLPYLRVGLTREGPALQVASEEAEQGLPEHVSLELLLISVHRIFGVWALIQFYDCLCRLFFLLILYHFCLSLLTHRLWCGFCNLGRNLIDHDWRCGLHSWGFALAHCIVIPAPQNVTDLVSCGKNTVSWLGGCKKCGSLATVNSGVTVGGSPVLKNR